MPDREKVIKGLNDIGGFIAGRIGFEQARNFLRTISNAIAMLKKQETQKFFVDESGKITPLPVVVRCKDCKYGNLWSDEQIIVCDKLSKTRDKNWFCADGKHK